MLRNCSNNDIQNTALKYPTGWKKPECPLLSPARIWMELAYRRPSLPGWLRVRLAQGGRDRPQSKQEHRVAECLSHRVLPCLRLHQQVTAIFPVSVCLHVQGHGSQPRSLKIRRRMWVQSPRCLLVSGAPALHLSLGGRPCPYNNKMTPREWPARPGLQLLVF